MRVITLFAAFSLAGCLGSISDGGVVQGQPDGGGTRGPDAKTVDTKAILRQWSGCMTLTNFQTADMANKWGTLLTYNAKQCQNCHGDGQYGFIASQDEPTMFAMVTQHSSYMSMYFTVDPATEKVIVNTNSFKGANSTAGHPGFNATDNQGMTALNTFFTATAAITTCDPPKMVD